MSIDRGWLFAPERLRSIMLCTTEGAGALAAAGLVSAFDHQQFGF